ncbi:MAG TPA: heavy metal translocating P-type ATPase [Acidiferrobacterales bacterium]
MSAPLPAAERPPAGPASAGGTACYHCGLPVPKGLDLRVTIEGAPRPMCCRGCAAVAQAIVDGGLSDYYRFRTERPATGRELLPEFLRQTRVYDNPAVQRSFVRATGGDTREAALILEGITCAACLWLNERHLAQLPGVLEVAVNYTTQRARVKWDDTRTHLSDILKAISAIGYLAHPYDPGRAQQVLERERREKLRRLGVAGVLGMQVMILAVALYAGRWYGMEAEFRNFFHWLSLALTLPVLSYSAQPFFRAAWRDLRRSRAGMDLPVALGISIAFAGSVAATVTGHGEVYYDSVVMFVFFLLTGRYFELGARTRAAEASESLLHAAPATATRLIGDGTTQREEVVAAGELAAGDRVRVRPGETVPCDGRVLRGTSSVNESLLTGESLPRAKAPGDALIGGSINTDNALDMTVERTGPDTVLSGILRLLERAQTEKPAITRSADRAANWLVTVVLTLTAAIGLYWWQAGNDAWLPIVVAMLVVTCPCALSLATPTAVTAATGSLTRRGLLTTRGSALETLARATHFVFDKTGTLTHGRLTLASTSTFDGRDAAHALDRAAALEAHSEHPIARALREAAGGAADLHAEDLHNTPGAGLRGRIAGVWHYLGTPAFVARQAGVAVADERIAALERSGHTVVLLAQHGRLLAAFALADTPRDDATALVAELRALGGEVWLLTGDQEHAARQVAAACGIDRLAFGLSPEKKLERIERLQRDGAVVAMIGDGINDAAALAKAHVSIAMGDGAQLAAVSADMVLLSDRLADIGAGVRTARKTLRIIRQNIGRSVAYNLIALPAAALGFVPPWLAALGMSASSLAVVLNALRLVDKPARDAGRG